MTFGKLNSNLSFAEALSRSLWTICRRLRGQPSLEPFSRLKIVPMKAVDSEASDTEGEKSFNTEGDEGAKQHTFT